MSDETTDPRRWTVEHPDPERPPRLVWHSQDEDMAVIDVDDVMFSIEDFANEGADLAGLSEQAITDLCAMRDLIDRLTAERDESLAAHERTLRLSVQTEAERDSLRDEVERLREALRRACHDGWADGAAAMEGYLADAAAAPSTGEPAERPTDRPPHPCDDWDTSYTGDRCDSCGERVPAPQGDDREGRTDG